MAKYYLTYVFLDNNVTAHGGISVDHEGIYSHRDIVDLTERVKSLSGHDQVVITNWQRYETRSETAVDQI